MWRLSWIIMMSTVIVMVKPNKQSYTTSNMVSILDMSIFSTDNFAKISLGRSCSHSISTLASLYVIQINTEVRISIIWCVNAITMCLKTVYNVTAKILWLRSSGRNGSQIFVTIKLICRAIRSCISGISISFFAICRGRYCRRQVWPIFIAKIIISHKDPNRSYKMWVLSCLWLY